VQLRFRFYAGGEWSKTIEKGRAVFYQSRALLFSCGSFVLFFFLEQIAIRSNRQEHLIALLCSANKG